MDCTIAPKKFKNFRALIYQECGISLNESKKALLVSRLPKRLRTLELDSFQTYYDMVAGETEGEEFTFLLDFVSTNKTDFFRDPKYVDFLCEQILPALQSTRCARIWSSAFSSGEEPYTIAKTKLVVPCSGCRKKRSRSVASIRFRCWTTFLRRDSLPPALFEERPDRRVTPVWKSMTSFVPHA